VEGLAEVEYQLLMELIRSYRSPKVLELTSYRNRRTHRVAPTVDHSALGVTIQSVGALLSGEAIPLFSSPNEAEFDFMHLYATAKDVYEHLLGLLIRMNLVVHA
jgi:hypothetical protein